MSRWFPVLAVSSIWFIQPELAQAAFTADAGTVALWHFDEGTGDTATDSVDGSFDLSLNRYPADGSEGSTYPARTEMGCFGEALDFSFADSNHTYGSYAENLASHSFDADAFSVELWVKTSNIDGILFLGGITQLQIWLERGGKIRFTTGDTSEWSPPALSDVAINDGQWHYVATTYDGSELRVYVDGRESAVTAWEASLGTLKNFYVGGRPGNHFLGGTLDEIRLSDVARTSGEISTVWNQQAIACPEPRGSLLTGGALLCLAGLAAFRRDRTRRNAA